ncbi:hypothetical protein N7532_009936 [Penicillium argentinense]|uniref:Rhodopsin domain-containing protein n=1 Tax=Penicillium argentinense TaxID=1131581 RepID=A0A9W9ENV8_9EURO|nr:uncharacterized protein N7532_009936 [Penicillium argentinense]KAJ5085165.1 hypothetical protein N7532_009936 [Penicillium argentinense]
MSVTVKTGNSLFLINYATQILCFVAVTVLLWLRLFVRWRLKRALGFDDAACVCGWVTFMGFCANALIYGFKGGTRPYQDLTQDEFEECMKVRKEEVDANTKSVAHAQQVSYVATAVYAPAALFVKSSLIYVLIRVFQPFYTAYWRVSEKDHATCLNQPGVIIADSIISFVTDIAIFAFPVALTWSLQMPIWKKIRVIFLLGLGGIAVAFSLYRLVLGVRESNNPNETTVYMKSILTANAEIGLGLICACLPALNVLTTHTQQRTPEARKIFTRRKKNAQPSDRIFEGDQFSRSQLSSCARRGSTDSAGLMVSHQASGFPVGDGNDTIFKMVSLNQHWENASQGAQRTDRTEII